MWVPINRIVMIDRIDNLLHKYFIILVFDILVLYCAGFSCTGFPRTGFSKIGFACSGKSRLGDVVFRYESIPKLPKRYFQNSRFRTFGISKFLSWISKVNWNDFWIEWIIAAQKSTSHFRRLVIIPTGKNGKGVNDSFTPRSAVTQRAWFFCQALPPCRVIFRCLDVTSIRRTHAVPSRSRSKSASQGAGTAPTLRERRQEWRWLLCRLFCFLSKRWPPI